MKGRKIAAMLWAVVLVVALCACTSNSAAGTTAPAGSVAPTGAVSAAPAATEEKIDISEHRDINMWMVSGQVPPDQDAVITKLNEMLAKDFNATLHLSQLGFDSEMSTKYRLLLSGGEQVDIIQGSNVFFSNYVSTGAYQALDDYLSKYAPDIWAQQTPDAWKEATYQGKIYAIPSLLRMYNPYGILYRKDLAAKYNVAPVTDFKTLETYLDAIKANEKDMLPFNICGDEIEYVLRMMRAYCGWDNASTVQSIAYTNNDQKSISDVFNFAETPKFKEFCQLMKSWYEKGYWSKSALSSKVWSRTNLQESLSGAGIDLFGLAEGTEVFTRCPSTTGAELDFFDWPTYLNIFHYDAAMGDACAFPINGKDLGRTLMVYNALMTNQTYYMLAQYGIEGKHYVVENGLHTLPEGVTADNNGYTYGNAGLWPLRNKKFYLTEKVFWQKALDNDKHYDEIATPNKLACFVLDTSAVQSQIAAIEQVNTQYLNPLVFGMAGDVDAAIQQYVTALKDAGSDALMETVKTQIAKYAADNGY